MKTNQRKGIAFILPVLAFTLVLKAVGQDIHFSQYNAAAIHLNPALTGFFDGNYRLTANFRSQWGSFATPYRTIAASVEGAFFKGKWQTDYLGIGLSFYRDMAGSVNLGLLYPSLSIAYKKALDRNARFSIAAGFQAGYYQRKVDPDKLIFDSQYDGVRGNPAIPSGENIQRDVLWNPDLSSGLLLHWIPSKKINLYIGGAYSHILEPDQSFFVGGDDRLNKKFTAHWGALIAVNDLINLLPSAAYYKQARAQEITGGSYIQFFLSEIYDRSSYFSIGSWVRINSYSADALIIGTRLDILGTTIGLSYDLNISSLKKASLYRGAYELSLIYTGKAVNRKGKMYSIPCPQL